MAELHGKKYKLFTLNSNRELAEEVAENLEIELSQCEIKRFADGEVSINLSESVRGYTVFVLQSTCKPVNENYMELFVMVDALKRASAKEINIIMPYYGYARQDRKSAPHQPISAKLMADLLQTAGVNRMLCFDLHAAQIQGFFNVPIDNFVALPLLAKYFAKKHLENIVVVSPDHGGTNRARKLAEALDAPLAIVDKRRPKPNQAEITNLVGDIEDKNCIVIDDMIDTAGTMAMVITILKQRGARNVYACCSHGVFSNDALDRINATPIVELVCTNTIPQSEEILEKYKWLKLISVAPIIAKGIKNIIDDMPVSGLFNYNKDDEE